MVPGNRTGTANYMAPEVVRRRATSPRLDIFSFGVTAYELMRVHAALAQGPGQRGDGSRNRGADSIVHHRPKINPRLAEAIMACLAAEPQDGPHYG